MARTATPHHPPELRPRCLARSRCFGAGLLAADADQLRRACVELLRAERLREELARAELELSMVLLLLSRGREDDRREVMQPRVRLHRREHVEAAQMRHHQVEQNEIDTGITSQNVERFAPIISERHPEWALLQLHLDDAADVWLIIGDEDVIRRFGRAAVRDHSQTRAAMWSRLRRSSNRSCPMFACGVRRMKRIASEDIAEMMAMPPR